MRKTPAALTSWNPRTGEVLGEVPAATPDEVKEAVAQARKVAPEWAAIAPEGRARLLREVRYRLHALMDEIVEVVSLECGKPRFEALTHDVLPPIIMMLNFEKMAPKELRPERLSALSRPVLPKVLTGTVSRIEWRPFGVVGCITPWNYPITNCFLAFIPALFAGNAVVIKPSEVTPRCGEIIRRLLEPLPSGVATVVQGGGEIGSALVDAPCDKISFIGSPATGRKICEAAAKHLTPVVMELGGKDAAIVCRDADLDLTSSGVLWGSFFNAGQTCCSIERAYVVDEVADEFERRLLDKLEKAKQDAGDTFGPLTYRRQWDVVSRHVSDAAAKGGKILVGGDAPQPEEQNAALWYPPTIVEGARDDMDLVREETFGPVLQIVRVRDEDEAVRRANEDGVNLTASLWTKSRSRASRFAVELRAGTVTTNFHGETAAASWSPWGGVGESGYGRLNGKLGLKEFVVPVHVARTMAPMKRMWWYPYDDASESAVRSITTFFGSPRAGERLRGLGRFVGDAGRALRRKH